MITHVVLLKLTDPNDRSEAISRLKALAEAIDEVETLACGTDDYASPGAFDIVLVTTHRDSIGLNAYQSHTVHREFIDWLKPRLEARAVVDTNATLN